jgi:large subunit ribosomal protein L18
MKSNTRKDLRERRHERVRKGISGTAQCPRLAIMISNRHMYAQMIDDEAGRTLVSVSTGREEGNPRVELAQSLGRRLGEAAGAQGLKHFVTDRGGFRFHGRVKAIVDGALEAGLTNVKEAK